MSLNLSIVEYLIEQSKIRLERNDINFTIECSESVAIFDELDSLEKEELISITALYLLGGDDVFNMQSARQQAENLGYDAVNLLAFAPDLGDRLERGCTFIIDNSDQQ